MIETGEGPPGIALFKLRDGNVLLLPIAHVPAAVETDHLVIDLSHVRDMEKDFS